MPDDYYAEKRERMRAYMRERRATGGDTLKAQELAAKTAFRATPAGKEARRREYRARNVADPDKRGVKLVDSAPFVGVDGEGGDDADGHHYYLLRAGDRVLETGKPLTWQDCFGFLADLNPTNIYVGYFFDYDVTMMCRSMPEYKIRRLLDREKRFGKMRDGRSFSTPAPVDVGPYEIDYIKRKCFKVRRATPSGTKNLPWVEVSDVGTFFQQSFVRTLADWNIGTPEEVAAIATGKDARAEFGQITDAIRLYNLLEIELLEKLMNKFRATCKAIGHVPRKFQGPGDLAAAFLQYHNVPKKTELPYWENEEFRSFADRSYYGGRFEVSAVGNVPGPIYSVDINSAYSHALTKVPCLAHGRWDHTGEKVEVGALAIYSGYYEPFVHPFRPPETVAFWGLPFRTENGGVSYPGTNGNGVYWSFEVDASIHQNFKVRDSWTYRRQCDCDMFPWVEDLYQQRLKLKKDTQGKVLKLALSSLYGKMAQRIGSAPYNNYVYGSFITAYCRSMLQSFIHSLPSCKAGECGSDVWMLATDGIYTSALPEGFQPSGELGGWDLKEYPDGLFIAQPGMYFGNRADTHTRLTRTRGIPANKAVQHEDAMREAFTEVYKTGNPLAATVPIPLTTFIGIRQATHRRKPELAGQWVTETRNITFDWRSKRQAEPVRENGYLRTLPPEGTFLAVSRPYDRALAKILDARNAGSPFDFSEQPDFRSEVITTPDAVL